MKRFIVFTFTFFILVVFATSSFYSFALPPKATLTSPEDRQIIPYYELYLRWTGVSGIAYYKLNMRDVTPTSGNTGTGGVVPINNSGPMVVSNLTVSASATYFVMNTSTYGLQRGHYYRWSLYTYDSSGAHSYCGARTFKYESGVNGLDTHIWLKSYSSASSINYFIDATNAGSSYSQYDALLQNGISKWNGVSSNVYLYRDYSSNTKKLGVYVAALPSDFGGYTYIGGYYVNEQYPYLNGTFNYIDIYIDKSKIDSYGYTIATYDESDSSYLYHRSMIIHEVGHALSLGHTDGKDSDISYTTFTRGNKIHKKFKLATGDSVGNIPLMMNAGIGAYSYLTTFVDRDHLRIKWGA